MNGTALYRALVEAGTSEERAKEAAESVVYAREGATKADIARSRSGHGAELPHHDVSPDRRDVRDAGPLMLAALRFTGPA